MQWQHLIKVERQAFYPILMFIIMDLLPMREKTADLLNKLSNGNKYSVELQRHKYDFVGGLIGGNPATMYEAPEGYNQLKAIGGMFDLDGKHYSVHSCYGLGKSDCGATYGYAKSKIIKAQGR